MMFDKVKKYSGVLQTLSCLLLIVMGFSSQTFIGEGFATVFFVLAFLVGGYASAKEGIEELVYDRHLSVDVLMILAAVGAGLIGYWMEGSLLIFIFSLSSTLEELAMEKSKNAISSLMNLTPDTARLMDDNGDIKEVLTADLKVGDRIQVRKGEAVPIDGVLLSGLSYFDEAMVTGEPIPARKEEGDFLIGGTLNQGSSIEMAVTVENGDTLFDKIISMVETAQKSKSKTATFIENLEDHYVKAVLILVPSFILFTALILGWDWKDAFYRGMILLTVASPCALIASSTPATLSAISRAAKKGMIVKGGDIMDKLGDVKAIVMDKTGTLTQGHPEVVDAYFTQEESLVRQIVAAAEKTSTHPIATALVEFTKTSPSLTLENLEDLTGQGLVATFAQKRWKIGKKGFVLDAEIKKISDREQALIDTWENEGKTLVYVSANQELMGIMALEDQLKPDSLVAVKALQNMGIKTIMLTGDQEKTARHIATELCLDDVVANCMPQDKSDRIKELQEKYGSVAMVGDGINDAPALVTADVSFAVGSGTDIAIESADVVLLEDLTRIPFAISLSQKMKHIVLENIIFALAIIISLIAANVVQVINLPLGVVGHEGSTILVILNGLRLLAFDQKFEKSYNKGKTCMKENPNDTCPKNCTYPDCLHPLG